MIILQLLGKFHFSLTNEKKSNFIYYVNNLNSIL